MSDPLKLTELDLLPQWAREPMPESGAKSFDPGDEDSPESRRAQRFERADRSDRLQREYRRPVRGERRDADRNRQRRESPERSNGPKGRGGPVSREASAPRQAKPVVEPAAPPPEIGLEISFLPDPNGAESMARQIRATCLAYPVFELAKVALKKDLRHHVIVQKKTGATCELFRCTLDGTLWLDRTSAAAHVVEKHLRVFYLEEQIPCDPPKGNFTALGVCSLDGTVLGPVNHHDYQAHLRRLHQKKFSRISFDEFKAKIQMVRDPEQIEAWRQAQAFKTVYVPRVSPVLPTEERVGESQAIVSEPVASQPPETEAPPMAEPVAPEETSTALQQEISEPPPPDATDQAVPAGEPVSQPSGESGSVEAVAEMASVVPEPERLTSLAAVRDHFQKHWAETFVVPVEEATLETVESRYSGAGEIVQQIRFALEQELRFPLKTAKVLIRQLGKFGLQFFKWGKGATFVSGIRPKRFDSDPAVLAEGARLVYQWVLARPGARREQLFKAMGRSLPAVGTVADQESEVRQEGATAQAENKASEQESSTPPGATELLWLVREGFVIAFADGRLDLIRTPAKKPEPNPSRDPEKVAVVEVRPSPAQEEPETSSCIPSPAQVDPLPSDPSNDPEAEREGAGDEPV
ncbi:MAG: hypothetical protein OHK005_01830 [Candidatus Methylacidiphilales bacterium]